MKQEAKVKEEETNQGWVSLHRSILETEIMKDSSLFHVFGFLLLRATHKATTISVGGIKIHLKVGQILVGSKSCPKKLKMGNKTWIKCLKVLKEYETINTEVVHGAGKKDLGTKVTLKNYTKYQSKEGREVCQTTPLSVSNNTLECVKQHTKTPLSVSNDLTNNKNNRISNKESKDFKTESQTEGKTKGKLFDCPDGIPRPYQGSFYRIAKVQDVWQVQVKGSGEVVKLEDIAKDTMEEGAVRWHFERNEIPVGDLPRDIKALQRGQARGEWLGDKALLGTSTQFLKVLQVELERRSSHECQRTN